MRQLKIAFFVVIAVILTLVFVSAGLAIIVIILSLLAMRHCWIILRNKFSNNQTDGTEHKIIDAEYEIIDNDEVSK